jgi:putative DNA primase/helicase
MEAASSCLHRLTWLWPGWLARGVVTLAASKSGDGKSALALELARRVASGSSLCSSSLCRGGPMCPPFSLSSSADAKTKEEEKQQEGPPLADARGKHMGGPLQKTERVIYVETEASEAVLRERVERWSVPEERLLVFTSRTAGGAMADVCLSDPAQLDALHEAAMETHPALVIVDSLSGAHVRDENSSRMRGIMMSLARLARNASCAVLVLHHLRKRPVRDGRPVALDCLRGSTAIAQFARCVWTIDRPDPTGPRRRLSQVKNNLAPCPEAVGFEVREDGVVFGPPPPEAVRSTVVERASEWLAGVLQEGALPGPELFRQAGECGFSRTAVYQAGLMLGAVKSMNAEVGHWMWRIPSSGAVPETA